MIRGSVLLAMSVLLFSCADGTPERVGAPDDLWRNIDTPSGTVVPHRPLFDGHEFVDPRAAVYLPEDTTGSLGDIHLEPTEVVFAINAVESSSCPWDGVERLEFDAASNRLYPIVRWNPEEECTSDASTRMFVVAVERSDLPPQPFVLGTNRVEREDEDIDGEAVVVDVG
ncbi:MAG: hypothetical protein ACR2P0_06140 [Acidimicrobiales bacterium]